MTDVPGGGDTPLEHSLMNRMLQVRKTIIATHVAKETIIMENSIITSSTGLYRPQGTRILYINGPITEDLACMFNLTLLELEAESASQNITVYINSPGGSVPAGLSMIDTMDIIRCDVRTVCLGMAASMGAWILMCGAKGKRFALPHSCVMLHQPLSGTGRSGLSQASDLKLLSDEMIRLKTELFNMVVERTGRIFADVERDCDRDFYMSSEKALEYGIIDEILRPHKG